MVGELQKVSMHVLGFQQSYDRMYHDQRTIIYTYDQVHTQILHSGNQVETIS